MQPIKYLKFEVVFNSTGKSIKGEHTFEEGMTAITGPNGKGKSVRLEMIEYALFGTKALRTSAAYYKSIKVTLEWDDYRIERTKSSANLFKGKEQIATGASPVNQHIIELFGYDLKVFRIAHHVKQGDIEALSTMGATERKAMVDQTVGLNILDDLISQYKDRTDATRNAKNELEGQIGPIPVEPDKPSGYVASGDLLVHIKHLRSIVSERNDALRTLAQPHNLPDHPQQPDGDYGNLVELDRSFRVAQARRSELVGKISTYPSEPPSGWNAERIAEQKKLNDEFARRPEQPEFEMAQLAVFETDFRSVQRQEIVRKIEGCREVTCPSCSNGFRIDAGPHETELAEHDDLYPDSRGHPEAKMPPIGLKEIERQRELHRNFVEVPEPEVSMANLYEIERQLEQYQLRVECQKELDGLEELEDVSKQLRLHEEYEIEMKHYNQAMERYQKESEEREKAQKVLSETENCDDQLDQAEKLYPICVQYESEIGAYAAQEVEYNRRKERVDQITQEYEDLINLRKALKDMKTKVKTYLVPSLNRVASQLINDMTEGDFANVEVDEDFNIVIDGQPIDTMSGGEKAVANLALRIALGRVLTHRKFSVLMGDEIDAAMDDERASLTQTCISQLSSSIAQIILVTHKGTEADNIIELR